MKRIFAITIVLAAILIAACDKVKNPIVVKPTAVGSKFITKDNSAVAATKKSMLEDYTGMRCPNCKAAADLATSIMAGSGGTIVTIAVHANFFAKPAGTTYTAEYRCDASEDWYTGFGLGNNPLGFVNRKDYGGNGVILPSTLWSSSLDFAKTDPMIIRLDVVTNYDSAVHALNVAVKGTFKAANADSLNITVALTEDAIHGVQDDNGTEVEYEFEHVMRGTLNGSWGTLFKAGASAVNDSVKVEFNNFDIQGMQLTKGLGVSTPKNIVLNDKNVSVVVFVSKKATKEILQVERVKIR
jgi:hypothetical protein